MTSRVTSNDRFPLLELPDVVLANVLQRCPPGSIAGFPLPLALAQVRVTGSVDPHWVRPLLHLAAKCPAVLDRVSMHLKSIALVETQSTNPLIPIAPFLTKLERLSIVPRSSTNRLSTFQMSALPTCLTKLSVKGVDLKVSSLEDLSASLLRLTALEDLDLGIFSRVDRWAVGGSLPRLRRLEYNWEMLPRDLGTFAPNLEALEAKLGPKDLEQLPITLTELRFAGGWSSKVSLLPLTRLTGLKDLCLWYNERIPEELPELIEALTALTQLEVLSHVAEGDLPRLVKALERGPKGLGLCLSQLCLDVSSLAVERLFQQLERLFRQLVHAKIDMRCTYLPSLPWAALTRLNRLGLEVDGRKDASWIQPLSQLPSLRELEVKLSGKVPEGFGALAQCTRLELRNIRSTANLFCLQHLTRLQECELADSPVECLAALPDCLTSLHLWGMKQSSDLPLGDALHRLTALEDLHIYWPAGEDRVCDLSPLKRLTNLALIGVPCPLIHLGALPCLRSFHRFTCPGIDTAFLRQLGEKAPSLRELSVPGEGNNLLSDASLAPLTHLSLLEVLELRGIPDITPKGIQRLLDQLPLLEWLVLSVKVVDITRWRQDPAWAELKQLAGDRVQLKTC